MSRKMQLRVTLAVLALAVAVNGCSSSVSMTNHPSTGQKVSYESTSTMIKDYKFEQPTINKTKEEQTSTLITVKFDQTVTEIKQDGTAIADITLTAVQCKLVNKSEVRYEFDNTNDKTKGDSLMAIIGKSYRISIAPNGKASPLDVSVARAVVVSGEGQKLAQKIFSDESIIERHSLPLPVSGKSVSPKQTWTESQPSPPGLLAPKTYEKEYSVTEVGKDRVVINMQARESLKKTSAQASNSAGGMGIFAKMFDNQDDFKGKLVINPVTGIVTEYTETLISSYTAQEKPDGAAEDAAPDTLLMRLTYGISLKKVN